MTRRTARFGILVGLTGGTLMAMWVMVVSALTGHGFLTPVNLIAHTLWRGAPLDGRFTLASLELGLLIHLTISICIGLVLAVLVEHQALDGAVVFFLALLLGMGAWVVQSFAWPSIDDAAGSSMVPWIFAMAHVIFSVGSAIALNRLINRTPDGTEIIPSGIEAQGAVSS